MILGNLATLAPFLFLWSLPLVLALDPNVPTVCYSLDGKSKRVSGYRCDNSTTGHSTCCDPGAICYSNGVCQQSNGPVQDYLRVGCTDKTWKDPACLEQCTTFATAGTAGIRFCKGAITSTNRYCCDDGNSGVGSFKCCNDQANIFAINPIASVLAQMPLSQLPTTSASSSTVPTNSAITTDVPAPSQTSSRPTPKPTDAESKSHAAAIGAGIGVPVGLIALGLMGWLAWRHRRKNVHKTGGLVGGMDGGYTDNNAGPQELDSQAPVTGAASNNKAYYGGREYPNSSAPLGEFDASRHEVHEMDTTAPR